VLVVTRSDVIPALNAITVAPVTRRVRGLPTEVALGEDDGLREASAASFDNLMRVRPGSLTTRIGETSSCRRKQICRALAALADC
jgi:mRNA interferase MazF